MPYETWLALRRAVLGDRSAGIAESHRLPTLHEIGGPLTLNHPSASQHPYSI